MSLTSKIETKKAILHNLGCDADDWLDGAKKEAAGYEGAKKALVTSCKNVQGLADQVTADMDEGKLTGLGPLEVAAYAKLQITRAVDSLAVQAQHMNNCQLSAIGEIAAYEKLVKHYGKLHDLEGSKIERIEEAIASGALVVEDDGSLSQTGAESGGRVPGARPKPGIAAQRKAEAEPKADAQEKPAKARTKSKKTFKCGNCGKQGHTSRGCPDKAPKEG